MRTKLTNNQKIVLICAAAVSVAIVTSLLVTSFIKYRIGMKTNNFLGNMSMPRGYRNNNPLNIRKSSSNWLGKITPGTDPSFEQFKNMGYGYRAALKLLRNYIRAGHNTIEKMISRWAPENENNTESYIANVCKRSGISRTAMVNGDDKDSLIAIAYAMSISENGTAPNRSDIEAGWEML